MRVTFLGFVAIIAVAVLICLLLKDSDWQGGSKPGASDKRQDGDLLGS